MNWTPKPLRAAVLLGAVALAPWSGHSTTPVAGRAAVQAATLKFLEAQDRSGRAMKRWMLEINQKGQPHADVGADGTPWCAAGTQSFVTSFADTVATSKDGSRTLRTTDVHFRDLECEPVSYSIIDFDRRYRVGDEEFVQPMRATVILRWLDGWKITHWHASLREAKREPAATPSKR